MLSEVIAYSPSTFAKQAAPQSLALDWVPYLQRMGLLSYDDKINMSYSSGGLKARTVGTP